MNKDYKKWMAVKANINNANSRPIGYKKREIWICCIGENIGHEEDGKGKLFVRPNVINLRIYIYKRQGRVTTQ
jgi:hypothetical protein